MFKAPSVVADHTLVYSGDPALLQPPKEPSDDSPSEVKQEYAKAIEKYENDLRVARDTGNWSPLIIEGQTPTLWHVRPIHGSLWDWFIGEANRRDLKQIEVVAFLLRVALARVDNFVGFKLEHKKYEGRALVTEECLDAIYSIGHGDPEHHGTGRRIVQELGSYLFARGQLGLRPL